MVALVVEMRLKRIQFYPTNLPSRLPKLKYLIPSSSGGIKTRTKNSVFM